MSSSVKFAIFGVLRFPDYLLALLFKGLRGSVVERVNAEKEIVVDPKNSSIQSRLMTGRVVVSFYVLITFANVPLVFAGVVKQGIPELSLVAFSFVYFYGPLRVLLFLASLLDVALSWIGGNVSEKVFFQFPDIYGKGRWMFAIVSVGIGVWALLSGMVMSDAYG